MKQLKKYHKPLKRKIHLDSGEWSYRVSAKAEVIHIVNPKGSERFTYHTRDSSKNDRQFPHNFFKEVKWFPDLYDYYGGGVEKLLITPNQIKKFIEEVLDRK